MTKFTADQELTPEVKEELDRLLKESETETLFICAICNGKLTGMKEVRKHVDEAKHYEYENPKHPHGRLLVG